MKKHITGMFFINLLLASSLFGSYSKEWESDTGSFLYGFTDIDGDSIMEVGITQSTGISFYNADAGYSLAWKIDYASYTGVTIAPPFDFYHPQDIDGDGKNEIAVVRYGLDGSSHYKGKIYVYDANTHAQEWASSEIAGLGPWVYINDIDKDGRAEIIVFVYDYGIGNNVGRVCVYGSTGKVEEDNSDGKGILNIYQNMPNPFSSSAIIEYELPQNGNVSIEFFNSTGQVVDVINADKQSSGKHSIKWQGSKKNHESLPAGNYFYRLIVDGKPIGEKKKAIILK